LAESKKRKVKNLFDLFYVPFIIMKRSLDNFSIIYAFHVL